MQDSPTSNDSNEPEEEPKKKSLSLRNFKRKSNSQDSAQNQDSGSPQHPEKDAPSKDENSDNQEDSGPQKSKPRLKLNTPGKHSPAESASAQSSSSQPYTPEEKSHNQPAATPEEDTSEESAPEASENLTSAQKKRLKLRKTHSDFQSLNTETPEAGTTQEEVATPQKEPGEKAEKSDTIPQKPAQKPDSKKKSRNKSRLGLISILLLTLAVTAYYFFFLEKSDPSPSPPDRDNVAALQSPQTEAPESPPATPSIDSQIADPDTIAFLQNLDINLIKDAGDSPGIFVERVFYPEDSLLNSELNLRFKGFQNDPKVMIFEDQNGQVIKVAY